MRWIGAVFLFVILTLSLLSFPASAAPGCGGSCFWIGGTGNFSNVTHWSSSSGGPSCSCTPSSSDTVTFDGSSGSGTATQDIVNLQTLSVNLNVPFVSVQQSGNTWKVAGSWNGTNGNLYPGTGTIRFISSGNFRVNASNSHVELYNVVIDAGVTVTYYTYIQIYNSLTVNGTMKGHNLISDPFLEVDVNGHNTNRPLIMGPNGDISQVGVFRYVSFASQSVNPMLVTSATYRYLSLLGEQGTEIRLAGDIRNTDCGIDNQCATLISGYVPGNRLIFRTMNYNMTGHAIIWFGDLSLRNTTAYLGNSTIRTRGFDTIAHSIVYLQNSTIHTVLPPGDNCTNNVVSYTQEYYGVVHAGNAKVTVGQCMMLTGNNPQYLYAENSTWVVNGNVSINGLAILDIGRSHWNITGYLSSHNVVSNGPLWINNATSGGSSVLTGSALSALDWTTVFLLFLFLVFLVIGFIRPEFHIMAGITGIILAFQIWTLTQYPAATILMLALSIFIMLEGMFRRTKGGELHVA